MTKELIEGNFRHLPFFEFLADASYQHIVATKCDDRYSASRHVRASIMASALSVECIANSLINYMQLPKKTADDIDKLPILSKIDTFTLLSDKTYMDRGDDRVAKITELIQIRNAYVHPKEQVMKVEVGEMKDMGTEWHMPMEVTGKDWPAIGIPRSAKFWTVNHSLSAMQALQRFYKYLFSRVLKFSEDEIFKVFIEHFEVRSVMVPVIDPELRRDVQALISSGVDFTQVFPMLKETSRHKNQGVLKV
ncbi:hypothetical protein [Acidovorax sp. Leaf78]|uniref:hypothetical protein n=1 Tax=Acidovorax sp. Leaf78 TaxID=1736237 RepID=UPI000AF9E082|nr:hypothetical protein [Acidovorax sp. Leaf78]